jgi:UDP-glucose 6-dehydrogenase
MTLVWPEKLAYDGKCLPKDTSALVAASTAAGHDPKLFRAVVEYNKELAKKK